MSLIVGGLNFDDFNCYVVASNVYGTTARSYERISVPGRNGDLLIDSKTYPNATIEYTVIFMGNFREDFPKLRDELTALVGYQKIVDSNDPDYYRMGYIVGELTPETNPKFSNGRAVIQFNVKPQRYLFDGDVAVEVEDSLYNPTSNDSFPIITVSGYGLIWIGNYSIQIYENEYDSIVIDCETMNATGDGANANSSIRFVSGQPSLNPGSVGIIKDNTITALTITPRWWVR